MDTISGFWFFLCFIAIITMGIGAVFFLFILESAIKDYIANQHKLRQQAFLTGKSSEVTRELQMAMNLLNVLLKRRPMLLKIIIHSMIISSILIFLAYLLATPATE